MAIEVVPFAAVVETWTDRRREANIAKSLVEGWLAARQSDGRVDDFDANELVGVLRIIFEEPAPEHAVARILREVIAGYTFEFDEEGDE
jgi:hypothetical protein